MKGAMVCLIVFVLFLSMKWVNPAKTAGEEYLDAMEAQVTRLQQQVQSNHFRQCELLASCTPANCSRRSCWPLVDDVQRSTCKKVQNNSYCAAPAAGTCPSKKFDFTKPYVRVANTTDWSSKETATTICAQRELSIVFKDICNSTSHSRAFFGSVDGTYIHFPGSDQSNEECARYDPRFRPWYCTSASVTKTVMVLLDVGESMGRKVPAPLEGSIFNVSQTIALALLNTLSAQDYVNIITFNSISATPLASSPVKVLLDNFGKSASPEFDVLKANLTRLTDLNLEDNGPQSSNISLGIAEALRNYGLLYNPSAMEIIVAFTDGDAKNLKDGALAALVGRSQTKVFIFKLPQPSDANQFLEETPTFLAQLRNISGSFNVITTVEAKNPLYSIRPYFSFLASVRANISSLADYSTIYVDFEHVVNNVFSITKPVFGDNQTLLGVVGLNIFVDELAANLTGLVEEAVAPRTRPKAFDPTKANFTANIQDASPAPPCPSIPTPPSTLGLCTKTDNSSTIENLACCDACSTQTPPNSTPPNSAPKYIAIGVSFGVLALAVFISVLVYCGVFSCWRKRKRLDLDVYPGLTDTARQTSENRDQE